MSDTAIMWTEMIFNVAYLVAVWALVVGMARRRWAVAPRNRSAAALTLAAFAALALGDTGHVGFRVLGYALGDLGLTLNLGGLELGLVGIGALATAFTVTLFYVLMLFVWRARFEGEIGWFQIGLLAAGVARVALMMVPANRWNSVVPPQPWATYRNLPLMVLGLGVAYLMLRDGVGAHDRTFTWIGVMILVSYACYLPVVLFVQRVPLLGMLMIPKTVAYLVIGVLAYRDLFRP